MKVSLLNLHCLNALCDDRENVSSILYDVRHSTHGDISIDEVSGCLEELTAEGMVSRAADEAGTEWFELTSKGRQELDSAWVDDCPPAQRRIG
jgi:DNA-binding PadR family transcriptional regulator